MGKFYPLTPLRSQKLRKAKLTKQEMTLWLYLIEKDPFGDRDCELPSTLEITAELEMSKASYFRALKVLHEEELLPEWCNPYYTSKSNIETNIRVDAKRLVARHRLHQELSGQTEVVTAVGRIDLLTDTEVIEIKDISDWKGALGQLLAYSAFFPNHSKRIHLFGKPDLTKLALAQGTCAEFNITVTFEEVQ
ncbi:MAG: hypothetical protein SAK29_24715 [Scytonema sp. PMC 1069.18]|nr:hypothetical protein [Scytonema sp. PMC 1069.18]MEC4887976.1 hypothetical protein [Scytonema sp. PMC 1070.18]